MRKFNCAILALSVIGSSNLLAETRQPVSQNVIPPCVEIKKEGRQPDSEQVALAKDGRLYVVVSTSQR